MNKYIILFLCSLGSILNAQEPYKNNETYTYDQLHTQYLELSKKHPKSCKLVQFGTSDYGKNIELFVINKEGKFQTNDFKNKVVLLINNAIHPGEPCGVDACVKMSKDLLKNEQLLPQNVVIAIIPMYNIGGGHNRDCCSRANQNGPKEYGFRGNALNLDLNRDFIKSDSRNTRVFYQIYHFLHPNVFVDTHTSNGADYQHIMTLITSQVDKMHPWLRDYTNDKLNPALFSGMDSAGYDMVPYVHQMKTIPDDGIYDYLETPRYSTGYTNLFNTIGFVTETHMLKTFEQRVESTYTFLMILIQYMESNAEELKKLKMEADYNTGFQEYFDIDWKLDTSTFELIDFKGYEAEYIKSEVTQLDRLHYNEEKPWEKKIRYYNHYLPTESIKKPAYYVIPQGWKNVIIRLQLNDVKIYRLKEDKVVDVEVYYIDDFQTGDNPYEGHYLHKNVKVSKQVRQMTYYKGDYVIPTRNADARFLVETLEPHAPDSYFAWNYFDGILQQKEWFSSYVFEATAKELLDSDPQLKKDFESKRASDPEFAEDAFAQLYYLYKRSPNYERSHNLYPVTRYLDEFMDDEIEIAPALIIG
ncbi:MAG: hypothetical protein H6582_13710 [Crocinitomicaceae bacterium]|nr:hypothetical protein [Crocinitomicaceae bacterium]